MSAKVMVISGGRVSYVSQSTREQLAQDLDHCARVDARDPREVARRAADAAKAPTSAQERAALVEKYGLEAVEAIEALNPNHPRRSQRS